MVVPIILECHPELSPASFSQALALMSEFAFGAGLVSSHNVSQLKFELHELLIAIFIVLATIIFVICFAVFPTEAFSDGVTGVVWDLG